MLVSPVRMTLKLPLDKELDRLCEHDVNLAQLEHIILKLVAIAANLLKEQNSPVPNLLPMILPYSSGITFRVGKANECLQ